MYFPSKHQIITLLGSYWKFKMVHSYLNIQLSKLIYDIARICMCICAINYYLQELKKSKLQTILLLRLLHWVLLTSVSAQKFLYPHCDVGLGDVAKF